jgi:low affinity Fe/Cu permease
MAEEHPTSPSDVTEDTTWFDRFADAMSNAAARAPFFLVCVSFALAWAVTGPFVHFTHGWVDSLEVVATLVTFLLVALLENESWRGNKATQRKLNAIASALAELMEQNEVNPEEVRQLNAAVGLEKRESSSQ